jgi:hypothetical protein
MDQEEVDSSFNVVEAVVALVSIIMDPIITVLEATDLIDLITTVAMTVGKGLATVKTDGAMKNVTVTVKETESVTGTGGNAIGQGEMKTEEA